MEMLSDAAMLKAESRKAIKASRRDSFSSKKPMAQVKELVLHQSDEEELSPIRKLQRVQDDVNVEMKDVETARNEQATEKADVKYGNQPATTAPGTQKDKPHVPPSSSSLSQSTPIPTPSTTTESPTITTTVHDPLPAVIQRLSDLERKFKAWSKTNHTEALKETVQTNDLN
ncbi:hypothetical protein Tco_1302458 [Tanacetum coccineum]